MYLLDTNAIIYYLKATLPEKAMLWMNNIVDDQPNISVITKIELLGFISPNITEQSIITTFVRASQLYGLDDAVVNQTIVLRKQHRIKLPDAIIAATAIVYDLTLVTRNSSDFERILNLKILDPVLL